MKKIYIAGPEVFLPEEQRLAYEYMVKTICSKYNLEGIAPMDSNVELIGLNSYDAMAIYKANINLIDECDAVLASTTPFRGHTADSGTVFEIGYAAAKGKPIIAYTFETKGYYERIANEDGNCDQGYFVESFGLSDNLMIDMAIQNSGGVTYLGNYNKVNFNNKASLIEAAVKSLSEILNKTTEE